jgi:hypothetical protein
MTTYPQLPFPKFRASDDTGAPLAGGKLYTYEAGGAVTPKTTYDAYTGGSANTNPVILDARGEADVFGDGMYYFVLTDANDVQQWVEDNVTGFSTTAGSESVAGVLQLATDAETITGTNATKATHPRGVKAASAFFILPSKTTMDNADTIAITDSAASNVNKKITYGNLVTALNLSAATGITVPNGGTGRTTLTDHGVLIGAGTDPINATGPGTAGQVLTSNGPTADPTFQAAPSGQTLQHQHAVYTASTGITPTPMTADPTSGTQILSIALTGVTIGSRINSRFQGTAHPSAVGVAGAAMFVIDGVTKVSTYGRSSNNTSSFPSTLTLEYEFIATSTSHTITVRAGTKYAGGSVSFNDNSLGGQSATLTVDEISA